MRDVDHGYDALRARLQKTVTVHVGIQGKDAGKSHSGADRDSSGRFVAGETVVEVASQHEFGLGVPRRSFIRDWFDQHEAELSDDLRKLGRAVLEGRASERQAAELFGLMAVGGIQERIAAGIPPANAERTIREKGSATPLIDTGQLRSSITHRVEVRRG